MSLGAASNILSTGRALMAAMQPLTGSRASGQIRMRTQPGTVVELPQHFYLFPIVDGERETSWGFKTVQGPNDDGTWTVDDSGNTLVTVMSNIGGVRHNVPLGTVFQADIPVENIIWVSADAPKAEADFTGASAAPDFCGVQSMAVYETFDGPVFTLDIHRSPIYRYPGVLLAFQDMEPADGVAIAQNDQRAVLAGDGKKFYKVTYSITVITTVGESDMSRRHEGLLIADTIMQLLNDKHQGDVGEPLSNPSGLQVRTLTRNGGPQDIYKKFYMYTVLVSAMVTVKRLDFRVYNPWLRAVIDVNKPQIPALPDQGDFPLVEGMEIDMTPDQLDLALDGTFARASDANLWVPENVVDGAGAMLAFSTGERRVNNSALGVYLESAVVNSLGAAAEDLTDVGWVASGSATVDAAVETSPLGGVADRIIFAADDDSQLDFAGIAATVGEPIVVQVFAKGPGNLTNVTFRFGAVDAGAVEHISDDITVGPNWELFRFELTPSTAGTITFRLKNGSDGLAQTGAFWGAFVSDAARWGAQYPGTGTKVVDTLDFAALPVAGQQVNLVTPQAVQTGRWSLRFRTPDEVPPELVGTGSGAPAPTLVSVGNGATELVTLRLIGTPTTGGALLTLVTRGDGTVLSLPGVQWFPGDELTFTIDATGKFKLEGTDGDDGDFTFPRYAEDAVEADRLIIGDLSVGGSSPVPGRYVAIRTNV